MEDQLLSSPPLPDPGIRDNEVDTKANSKASKMADFLKIHLRKSLLVRVRFNEFQPVSIYVIKKAPLFLSGDPAAFWSRPKLK